MFFQMFHFACFHITLPKYHHRKDEIPYLNVTVLLKSLQHHTTNTALSVSESIAYLKLSIRDFCLQQPYYLLYYLVIINQEP